MSRCSTRIALALAAASLSGCAGCIYSGEPYPYAAFDCGTSVYYTADSDAPHYVCARVRMRASEPDAYPAATWTIPVVGDCSPGRCVGDRGRS